MEKIFSNNRLLVIAFFTVFSTTAIPSAKANENHHAIPVELKFIRWIKKQPLFQLSFAGNAEQNEFTIIIRDEFNNTLYKENIHGENFTKTFLLNMDEIGEETLEFEVVSKKLNRSIVYQVNRYTFLQEELAIH
jgi:hypothetical protein